jgi:LysM repeat protein
MTNLFTQAAVVKLSIEEGWTPGNAEIGGAIAMVESPAVGPDGKLYADADAIGDQHLMDAIWDASYSLYMVRATKADRGTGRPRDRERLPDPRFNARSALTIYNAQGFNAWSTYQTGQYKAYLPALFPPPPNTHVIVFGDTLGEIASRYGTTVEKLMLWNDAIKDPSRISIGQKVIYAPAVPPQPPARPYVPPPFPQGLALDKAVPSARGLQRALKQARFMAADVALSDNYGPKTQAAVGRFHDTYPQFRDKPGDPVIGPNGWAFLWDLTDLVL